MESIMFSFQQYVYILNFSCRSWRASRALVVELRQVSCRYIHFFFSLRFRSSVKSFAMKSTTLILLLLSPLGITAQRQGVSKDATCAGSKGYTCLGSSQSFDPLSNPSLILINSQRGATVAHRFVIPSTGATCEKY